MPYKAHGSPFSFDWPTWLIDPKLKFSASQPGASQSGKAPSILRIPRHGHLSPEDSAGEFTSNLSPILTLPTARRNAAPFIMRHLNTDLTHPVDLLHQLDCAGPICLRPPNQRRPSAFP
jgi:hypothetical protein